MGIDGFRKRLEPYARQFRLRKYDNAAQGFSFQNNSFATSAPSEAVASKPFKDTTNLIIDGPSLAYYVYHRLVANNASAPLSLGDLPSYSEACKAVSLLLEELETYGFLVDSIFFDGYLPDAKQSTRRERFRQSRLKNIAFRSAHPTVKVCKSSSNNSSDTVDQILHKKWHSSSFDLLPTIPFLVPAVLEFLQQKPQYRSITKVVPGEADVFCKTRSDEISNRAILTNDSDLIVLHPHCKIIFLNELEHTSKKTILYGLYYEPCAIAKQLKLPNLVALGYFADKNKRMSLRECAARAKAQGTLVDSESYRTFSKAYMVGYCQAPKVEKPHGFKVDDLLKRLDPRISECVLPWIAAREGQMCTLVMYLPPLIDDTDVSNGWSVSESIRRLAYSVLRATRPDAKMEIGERRRRGSVFFTADIALADVSKENELLMELASRLRHVEDVADIHEWVLWSVTQVLTLIRSLPSPMPFFEHVSALVSGQDDHVSWGALNFHANVDGLFYSLRILAQIIRVYVAFYGADRIDSGHEQAASSAPRGAALELDSFAVKRLGELLDRLPSIQNIHTRPGESYGIDMTTRDLRQLVCEFHPAAEAEASGAQASDAQEGDKKRKRKKKATQSTATKAAETATPKTCNMYDLLSET